MTTRLTPAPFVETVGDFLVVGHTRRVVVNGEARTVLASVTVELSEDASDATLSRGITTGAMRRVEAAVKRMADAAPEDDEALSSEHRREAERLMRDLRDRAPRGDATYYRDLLDASNALQLAGDRESLNTLSEALSVTKGTIRSRLLTARREREDAIRAGRAEGVI